LTWALFAASGFDFERFFTVGEGFTRAALRVNVELADDEDPYRLTRGEWVPNKPLRCERDEGNRLLDLIGTTWAVLQIVSDRVIDVLQRSDFGGWSTYPVEISREELKISGYQGLSVVGRCGSISHEDVMLEPAVPEGESVEGWRGIYFDPDSWDGSDLFSPEGTASFIVTADVKRALEAIGATNFNFTRLTEFEMPSVEED
jgi:hypothetical protein